MLGVGCRPRPALSPQEIAQNAPRISFTDFQLSVSENVANEPIIYVDGVVKNGLDRTISALGVTLRFRNSDGQVVFRESGAVVHEKRRALAPGESRRFRLGFEGVPYSWNRAVPELEITRLVLE